MAMQMARQLVDGSRAALGELIDGTLWMKDRDSARFWQSHYRAGGTSGPGSRGALADFKALTVNQLVHELDIASITELGCGDGYQAGLLDVPRYVGLDVASEAIAQCARLFGRDPTKTFAIYRESSWSDGLGLFRSDMALSMDVIFHLVEDKVFDEYMHRLFGLADRFVLVYSSNTDQRRERLYTRPRMFSSWVERNCPTWILRRTIPTPGGSQTNSSFYLYEKLDESSR